MSELHIRINKRWVERSIFLVIIAVLAVLLLLQPAGEVDSSELDALQEQVDTLSAQNQALEEQVDTLESDLEAAEQETAEQEVEETTETEEEEVVEETLSGEVEVTLEPRATTEGDRLDYATVVIENGLETSQELTYRLHWRGVSTNQVPPFRDTITLSSGETYTLVVQGGDDISSFPPENDDYLRLTVTDSSDSSVAQLERSLSS